jgi:hypothetical protein
LTLSAPHSLRPSLTGMRGPHNRSDEASELSGCNRYCRRCGNISLQSLAVAARDYGYLCRPRMVDAPVLDIQGGRHPLQELCVGQFIANDTLMPEGEGARRMKLLTGPNASGKSVYLKQACHVGPAGRRDTVSRSPPATIDRLDASRAQVAILVYMAHLGVHAGGQAPRPKPHINAGACFATQAASSQRQRRPLALLTAFCVSHLCMSIAFGFRHDLTAGPAARRTRIHTRETVSVAQSTFMIDLLQMSAVLRYATPHSLVIVDEFGKGVMWMERWCSQSHTLLSHWAPLPRRHRARGWDRSAMRRAALPPGSPGRVPARGMSCPCLHRGAGRGARGGMSCPCLHRGAGRGARGGMSCPCLHRGAGRGARGAGRSGWCADLRACLPRLCRPTATS